MGTLTLPLLGAWSPAAKSEEASRPIAADKAFSEMSSFARKIGADEPKAAGAKISASQINDHAFSELQSFAQRVGAGQPASLKGQVKLAEADNLLELGRPSPRAQLPPRPRPPSRPRASARPRRSKPTSSATRSARAVMRCRSRSSKRPSWAASA